MLIRRLCLLDDFTCRLSPFPSGRLVNAARRRAVVPVLDEDKTKWRGKSLPTW
jgi:hypothetical protein